MKKLMFAAVVAAMAMGAQADFINGSFYMYFDDVEGYAAYNTFYALTVSDYANWAKRPLASTLADASWVKTEICNDLGDGLLQCYLAGPMSDADFSRSGISGAVEGSGFLSLYAVLTDGNGFYAREISAGVSDYHDGMWGLTGNNEEDHFSGSATAFAVPEPTSALLMLFGLAGLALKRKVA